jgi:cytochrome bd-type quinol oxidase subunit 2
MKTRLKLFTAALLAAISVGLFALPTIVLADAKTDVCQGIALTGADCSTSADPQVDKTIKLVINILSIIVGVAAVIMIIIGGLKYITSQGEGSNTAGAKNTILYAIIGLVIVALAQVIVVFVLNKAVQTTSCPAGQTLTPDPADPSVNICV